MVFSIIQEESQFFLKGILQALMKSQYEELLRGDYRNFVEGLGSQFQEFYVEIERFQQKFSFGDKNLRGFIFFNCIEDQLKISQQDRDFLQISLCRPPNSMLGYLGVSFAISIVLAVFSFRMSRRFEKETCSRLALFLNELGLHVGAKPEHIREILIRLSLFKREFEDIKNNLIKTTEERSFARMASFIAHDLRPPLESLVEVLQIKSFGEWERLRPMASSAMERMRLLLKNLNKRKASSSPIHSACSLNFQDVCLELQMEVQGRFQKKGLTFSFSAPPGLVRLGIDKEAFERCLLNLIYNACDFSIQEVAVKVQTLNEQVLVEVIDDGHGVPSHLEGDLFKSFFCFGKEDGYGLGLTFVWEMMTQCEGEVFYQRRGLRTVFSLLIPYSKN